jgi:hypothetical protein
MRLLSRREALQLGLCGCAFCAGVPAPAAEAPLTPLVGKGYEPVDDDERGLWQAFDRLEQLLADSNLVVRDAGLNEYVRGVTGSLLGDQAADLRIYIVRDPNFNASMAPNGLMMVHTGLLVRMRDEAQLAAVLGHESGHYLRRHSLQSWRSAKTKSAFAAFVGVAGAGAGGGWYGLAAGINNALLLSLFSFSRTLESEADAYGLQLLHDANYPPGAAAQVWSQLVDERKASAAARKQKYKDNAASAFSTHPPSEERMRDLSDDAQQMVRADGTRAYDDRRLQYQAAVRGLRPVLIEEQVKLNDAGASLFLLDSLATEGWDGVLRYYQGEVYRMRGEGGDALLAAQAYAASVAFSDAPPEAYRAHGYMELVAGRREEGRRFLGRYLELNPDAPDAEMVRFTLAQ